jgi:tetratricopeptide (TPR) repeat protein
MKPFATLAIPIAALACAVLSLGRPSEAIPYQQAVEHGPIYGTVLRQSDNAPIPRIKITLSTNAGEIVDTEFTSMDGKFTFGGLAFGVYILEVNAEGFEPYRDNYVLLNHPLGTAVVVMLRDAVSRPAAPGAVVSTREMSLPQAAQDALHKGVDELFQKRDPAASLVSFKKVLDAAPTFYEATYYEGLAYWKLGKDAEAEASFKKAIEQSDHHFVEPCISLASMLDDNHDFADAQQFAQESVELQPEDWRAQYELARALLGLVRFEDAEKSALEAKRLKPDFPRLYIILADIHLQLHKNQAVLDDIDAYLKLEPSGPYSQQAKALKEKTEEAIKRGSPPSGQ